MFDDRDRHARTPAREVALSCLQAGIEAAQPAALVAETVDVDGDVLRIADRSYNLGAFDRVILLGGGKAADGLARALLAELDTTSDDGIVVTTEPARSPEGSGTHSDRTNVAPSDVDVRYGDHPVPTERNVEATERLLRLADSAGSGTLVLFVVTGGASALLAAPAPGLSLADVRRTTSVLLESGATIDELNAVRKHCSAIKGGRLTGRASPATVLTLAISDVVGDDPSVVGSGPTVPDPTTYDDSLDVIDRYGETEAIPEPVVDHLRDGVAGRIDETPAADELTNEGGGWHTLGSGRTAIEAARAVAREDGFDSLVLSSQIEGEACDVGRVHAAIGLECLERGDPVEPPAVILSGGEVTVTVTGTGTGGPNQELALAAAVELAEATGERASDEMATGGEVVLASVDTDGVDGPTDAAGAIVDTATVAGDRGGARDALAATDAGTYLHRRGGLLRTGETGTNVNDIRAVVVTERSGRSA
ncbi:glycerate kinase type-2 family protein [Halovivax gelatinilyticus]|uniref:glycerate kinase type-2 family protein n=1 Tax=Halovivax gelatinilyticus TaxID=2961597 RepID=UPI0020CA48AB|nr:DUF4147 domain-containing protein [Halovivax gelatinilyticus]